MRNKWCAFPIALLLIAAVAGGCNEPSASSQASRAMNEPSASSQTPWAPDGGGQIVRRVQIGFAHWGATQRSTLKQMVANRPVVLLRVTAADTRFSTGLITDGHEGDLAGAPPADDPKSKGLPSPAKDAGLPWTTYTAEVIDVVAAGGVRAGDLIYISQAGGLVDGTAYEMEGDPVIEVGKTYLMSLGEPRPGLFTNTPYDRFELDTNGRLQTVNSEWDWVPRVAALNGLSMDAAAVKIREAVASSSR